MHDQIEDRFRLQFVSFRSINMMTRLNRHVRMLILSIACSCCPHVLCLISPLDVEAVQRQLGYLPLNLHSISARHSSDGSPVAIQTYPLHGGAPRRQAKQLQQPSSSVSALGAPFPTLFWLTHPDISKAVADLERRGFVGILEERLNQDKSASDQLLRCHQDYARRRWDCILPEDQQALMSEDDASIARMRVSMKETGIAGIDYMSQIQPNGSFQASLKCLHAHYGHYRSVGDTEEGFNPVGYWVHKLLHNEFPHLIL
jgi:hypothetical protein